MPVVKIQRAPGAELPQRATPGSAAMDLRACLPPDTICLIPPGERLLIPTGLRFEIPVGYMISLRPRSGWALRSGLILPNSPATIDADFRGELQVLVMNLDREAAAEIRHRDRIAQMLLERVEELVWEESSEPFGGCETTIRGTGGFGSTGLA